MLYALIAFLVIAGLGMLFSRSPADKPASREDLRRGTTASEPADEQIQPDPEPSTDASEAGKRNDQETKGAA